LAGVNQQPPIYQFRMRPFKSFWDEPKTHPPLHKAFGFFSLCCAPKFFLPTYLPPTYLPPPTYLTSFCAHSIVKAQESFKWEGRTRRFQREARSGNYKQEGKSGSQDNTLELGAKSDNLERKLEVSFLPSLHFFFVIFLHGLVATKKALL
jgi:hypothetical protein